MAGAGNVPMFKFWYERIVKHCWKCDLEVAGAGHVEMFKFFYQRIMKQHWKCDLEVVNNDRRNLWSIAGLAHVDAGAEQLRGNVNPEIKTMVKHLHEHGHILGEGVGSRSDPSSIRAVHAALAVRAAAE